MKKIFAGIILLLLCKPLFAEPVNLKVKVDRDKITIGDRIKYEAVMEYDNGVEIEPYAAGKNLGEFEIKDYKIEAPRKIKSGKLVSKAIYTITTFTTGEFTIPGLKIKYKNFDKQEKEILSDEIKIKVESVKPGPNDMDDIRPLKDPAEIKDWFLMGLSVIFILFAAAIAVFIYFRKKKEKEEKPALPPRPAEEIAKDALKALKEMKLIEKGLIKEYYIRLSDIIRTYIEDRYSIFAMDRTTWELFQEMKSKRIERLHVDRINDFLEDCDMVKFAKYMPSHKEIEEVYKRAEEIVDITTPKITA
ncbi:MAG: BatD family protein [Candidatus Omnitrophica bacterium]|nr:BatD family protein [Candidatus Omnitrophota bacterium]